MNKHEVLRLLQDTRQYLSSIPYINNGGCAVSALAIYDTLKKNSIEAEIVYSFNCGCSQCKNAKLQLEFALTNNEYDRQALVCYHALVKVPLEGLTLYLDNNSCTIEMYDTVIPVPEEIVVEAINYAEWNPTFSRSWIPEIKEHFNLEYDIKP